jgi:RNA polymerase-interacting CarD/CdnL/TRCF family regulator
MHLNRFLTCYLRDTGLQIQDLKKKQENQVQLLKEKQKSDEAARKLQEEIQFIKSQKVPFPSSCCL